MSFANHGSGMRNLGNTALSAPSATIQSLSATGRPGFERAHDTHADLTPCAHDRDLTERIMRKRQEEMQRRTKLLDPRKRQFGVDHAVLDAQLREKRAAQEAEVEEESRHAEAQLLQDHVLHHLEGLKQAAMRSRHKAATEFSLAHLHKETRREYALSDPNGLKKDRPIDVDDKSLGPSCFQTFEGQADADPSIRKRAQQQQVRDYLQQQIREKHEREQAEREQSRRFDEEAIAACQVRSYCEHAEREERRLDKIDEAAHNRQLAEVHSKRRQARAEKEAEDKARHVEHVKESLREAPGKERTDCKRLTIDEEQEHYNAMAMQVLEKQIRRQAELAEEAEHAQATATGAAVLSALEAERERQQKARVQRMVEHNKVLEDRKHKADDDERRKYRSWEHEP
mmetsp:Transcript_40166/g.93337  ORF Transcript_40166/g.93337 Transcript_40166/m.93337 type:complete len:399 (+) Transcript_40166:59-1255(+)